MNPSRDSEVYLSLVKEIAQRGDYFNVDPGGLNLNRAGVEKVLGFLDASSDEVFLSVARATALGGIAWGGEPLRRTQTGSTSVFPVKGRGGKWRNTFKDWFSSLYGMPPEEAYSPTASRKGSSIASWLLSRWADTSGDGSATSVMLQHAAAAEFGLEHAYKGVFRDRMTSDGIKQLNALERHQPFLRAGLRKMYERTQRELATVGDSEFLTLYRGMGSLDPGDTPGGKGKGILRSPQGDLLTVSLQPLSAFSASYAKAELFVRGKEGGVMIARVPKTRILSTPMTGFGCLHEKEVVVLGGLTGAFVQQTSSPAGMAGSPDRRQSLLSQQLISRLWGRGRR